MIEVLLFLNRAVLCPLDELDDKREIVFQDSALWRVTCGGDDKRSIAAEHAWGRIECHDGTVYLHPEYKPDKPPEARPGLHGAERWAFVHKNASRRGTIESWLTSILKVKPERIRFFHRDEQDGLWVVLSSFLWKWASDEEDRSVLNLRDRAIKCVAMTANARRRHEFKGLIGSLIMDLEGIASSSSPEQYSKDVRDSATSIDRLRRVLDLLVEAASEGSCVQARMIVESLALDDNFEARYADVLENPSVATVREALILLRSLQRRGGRLLNTDMGGAM